MAPQQRRGDFDRPARPGYQQQSLRPLTRYVGSKAAFRVVATGALPITYQWYKNDTTPITGATNDTLWLSKAQLADDGSTYSAHVTGPFFSSNTPPPRCRCLITGPSQFR